jgi:hypothetical protein
MASARVIAGRMVVSRRASIDVPAPGGPSMRRLWSERLDRVHRCLDIDGQVIAFYSILRISAIRGGGLMG